MASRELSLALRRLSIRDSKSLGSSVFSQSRRYASGESAPRAETSKEYGVDFNDLEEASSISSVGEQHELVGNFDPIARASKRWKQLPGSRYQYRSPRYYRGPLHPHQPPPKSDPSSREFVPGPFSRTRLDQTYNSTVAQDLMALTYVHVPPGTEKKVRADRLRTWDDSSPYHKGRPKRGPRGPGGTLPLIEKDLHWQNIPKIERVTVHSMVKRALEDIAHLHIASMMLQSITGVKPVMHRAKHSSASFGLRAGNLVSLTSDLRGNQAEEFVDRCFNIVFPRIKNWPGVRATTGDGSGNISFGFGKETAILFPEVEVNYDMYPPRMIPGFHVTIHTSATSDRHAKLLLAALGMPFYYGREIKIE